MNRNQLVRLLKSLLEEKLTERARFQTFGQVQSSSEGLTVSFSNGKEFRITVVQSKIGKEDE